MNSELNSDKSLPGVDKDGTVHVCAWCYPGDKFSKAFPHLAHEKISHGICQRHKNEKSAQWMINHRSAVPQLN